MFLIFLSLSVLFWFLSKLSKEYIHVVTFKTAYINISNTKILQKEPLKKVDLTLKTTGFGFISLKVKRPKLKIDLANINRLKNGKYYCLLNKQLSSLQSQVNSETTIVAINLDTIFFDFGNLKSKKVSVIPKLNLNFKNGYYLTNKIKVAPDSITISGPQKQIDSIKQIETELLNYNAVFKDINKSVAIKTVKSVKYSTKKVKIIGKVEKFTEGNLELPFKLINVNDSINISTFINKVHITYKVSLKNFDKVFVKDFSIVCDFAKTQKDSLNFLIPEFISKSFMVSDLKITPSKIEYLIKK